jgi:hypothetical protein
MTVRASRDGDMKPLLEAGANVSLKDDESWAARDFAAAAQPELPRTSSWPPSRIEPGVCGAPAGT